MQVEAGVKDAFRKALDRAMVIARVKAILKVSIELQPCRSFLVKERGGMPSSLNQKTSLGSMSSRELFPRVSSHVWWISEACMSTACQWGYCLHEMLCL